MREGGRGWVDEGRREGGGWMREGGRGWVDEGRREGMGG